MLLFSTTLAGFYIFDSYLLDLMFTQFGIDLSYTFLAKMLFMSFAVSSGIAGSLIIERVDQRKFLWSWLIFGLLVTVSLAFFGGLEFVLVSSVLMGVSFGLGFPTCQAFLTESTTVEERGRVSGVTIFIAFALVVIAFVLAESLTLGFLTLIGILVALKGASFLALAFDRCPKAAGSTLSWRAVVLSKGFVAYALPWLIFHLANGIFVFGSLPSGFKDVVALGSAVEYLGTILTALIAGFAADYFGRKQPLMIGMTMLAVGYGFYGLAGSAESYFVFLLVDGIAWGLIAVTYMQVILGDLASKSGSKEKFYALGGIMIPLLTYQIFSSVQAITNFTIPANTISSFLSIAVILSVIPVYRAAETLPETKIRERKMQQHLKKVSEIIKESEETE
jgi:MFS family permease